MINFLTQKVRAPTSIKFNNNYFPRMATENLSNRLRNRVEAKYDLTPGLKEINLKHLSNSCPFCMKAIMNIYMRLK